MLEFSYYSVASFPQCSPWPDKAYVSPNQGASPSFSSTPLSTYTASSVPDRYECAGVCIPLTGSRVGLASCSSSHLLQWLVLTQSPSRPRQPLHFWGEAAASGDRPADRDAPSFDACFSVVFYSNWAPQPPYRIRRSGCWKTVSTPTHDSFLISQVHTLMMHSGVDGMVETTLTFWLVRFWFIEVDSGGPGPDLWASWWDQTIQCT